MYISFILYATSIIGCVVTIMIIYLMFDNNKAMSEYTLQESWVEQPIISIDNMVNNTCPRGKQMIFGKWPGSNTGCYCENRQNFSNINGACNNLGNKYCYTIDRIPATDLFYWKNTTLCAEYLNTYLDLTVVKNQNCPEYYKPCGILDTFQNTLCVKYNSTCPYNFVKIIPQGVPIADYPKYQIDPSKYHKIVKLNTGEDMVLSNYYTDRKIFVNFHISDGKPCESRLERNANFSLYPLEKLYGNQNTECKTNPIYYETIDTDIFQNLYDYNGISKEIIKRNPPLFSKYDYSKKPVYLFLYDFLGIDAVCKNKLKAKYQATHEIIFKLQQFEEKFYDYTPQKAELIFTFFGFIVLLVNATIFCILKLNDEKLFYIMGMFSLLFIAIPKALITVYLLIDLIARSRILGLLVDYDCFANANSSLFERYDILDKSILLLIFHSIFSFIFLGSNLSMLSSLLKKGKYQRIIDSDDIN